MLRFLFLKLYSQSDSRKSRHYVVFIFSLHRIMSRKLSFDEIYRRAQTNDYKFTAYHEEDSKRIDIIYVSKTIKN